MRVVIARSLRLCIRPPGADGFQSLEIMADKTIKELKNMVCFGEEMQDKLMQYFFNSNQRQLPVSTAA